MDAILSVDKQLDLVERALAELERKHASSKLADLYMCWIFYYLLDLPSDHGYWIDEVTPYIELFTRYNMNKHSNTRDCDFAPYFSNEYEERKKFLEWMISEYKNQLN